MNLTTDAWIPVVRTDGRSGVASLVGIFQGGEEIRDLAVRPHERIALMRLLLCIAQAALDGPETREEWEGCRARIGPASVDYLARTRDAFELFGDGPRFLQVQNLDVPAGKGDGEGGNSPSKLDLALATGNNPTLFDNSGGGDREFHSADLALMLLTFQCFSPGGRIGVAEWKGVSTPGKGSSEHGPCLAGSMLHAVVRASDLLDTLHRNSLAKDQVERFFGANTWGVPVWERMPGCAGDLPAARNATETYLGRLVPLSRCVRLTDDGRTLLLGNGLSYPDWREPTATIITREVKNKPTRVPLPASVEKAAWRELPALVVISKDAASNGGPAALQNVDDGQPFDLWAGGLAANKAKLVDTVESVLHVPAAMLRDTGQKTYEQGVGYADSAEWRLRLAVSEYHQQTGDKLDRPEMRNRRKQLQRTAVLQFWSEVEQAVARLLDVVAEPGQLGLKGEWGGTAWGRAVNSAAGAAYDRACPRSTSRQFRAHALGLRKLFAEVTGPVATPENEEEGS